MAMCQEHPGYDVRQRAHARRWKSYQTWFGEVLSIRSRYAQIDLIHLRQGVQAVTTAIWTSHSTDVEAAAWQTILAKLRRARLLAREDPNNPGQLDTHPLVREYFGEQLRSQQTDAWKGM